jgi:hypothetical protein
MVNTCSRMLVRGQVGLFLVGLVLSACLGTVSPGATPAPGGDGKPDAEGMRTWTDSTGTRKTKAALVRAEGEKGHFRLADGKEVVMPLDKLCKEDQTWIAKQIKRPAGEDPRAETRVAVIGSQAAGVEKLVPLVELRLGQTKGIALLERGALKEILREQELQALMTAGGTGKRIALGKLLKADLLVFLAGNEQPKPHVMVVVCETQRGLRLVAEPVLPSANIEADVDAAMKHVETAAKKRKENIVEIVAVPLLVNNSLTHEADRFQGAFAKLVERDLMRRPGVLVVELDEAKALGRELVVSGAAGIERRLPLYLMGEYRFDGAGDARRGQFAWKLLRGEKELDRRQEKDLAVDKVPGRLQQTAVELVDKALGKSDVRPDAEAEAQQLAARARIFMELGAWDEALAMIEASLLLKSAQPALHEQAIRAIMEMQLTRGQLERMKPYNPRKEAETAMAQIQWLRAALPHIEACWREPGLGNAGWCMKDKYWTAVEIPSPTPELLEAAFTLYRERQAMVERVLQAKAAARMAALAANDKTPGRPRLNPALRPEEGLDRIWRWTEPPYDQPEGRRFFSCLMRSSELPTSTQIDRAAGEYWVKKRLPEICANRLRLLREYGDILDFGALIRLYHDGGREIVAAPVYVKFLEEVKALPSRGMQLEAERCLKDVAKELPRRKDPEERSKELAEKPSRTAPQRPPVPQPSPAPQPPRAPEPVTDLEVVFHPLSFDETAIADRVEHSLLKMTDGRDNNPLDEKKLAVFPAGERCDVFVRSGRIIPRNSWVDYVDNDVFLMKEKGRLQRLPLEITPSRVVLRSGAKLTVNFKYMACWDGQYVWAMSAGEKGPLAVIDPRDNKIWKCGPDDGLPPSSSCGVVALGPGEVCVAGYFGRLWIAIVRFEPRKGFKVEVIHEARVVPKTFAPNDNSPERHSPTLAEPITFVSLLTAADADGAPQRRVVVGRYGQEPSYGPGPLLVDPETRKVTSALNGMPAPWFCHAGALYWQPKLGFTNQLMRAAFPDFKNELVNKAWLHQGASVFYAGKFHAFSTYQGDKKYCVAADATGPLRPVPCNPPSCKEAEFFVSRHYGLLLSSYQQLYHVELKGKGS